MDSNKRFLFESLGSKYFYICLYAHTSTNLLYFLANSRLLLYFIHNTYKCPWEISVVIRRKPMVSFGGRKYCPQPAIECIRFLIPNHSFSVYWDYNCPLNNDLAISVPCANFLVSLVSLW